jgi:hypothetical protein
MILDTVFDSSRLQRLRLRNLFERLAQLLPSFTGWEIEVVIEVMASY